MNEVAAVPAAIPAVIGAEGEEFTVRRAWPASRNRIAFEAVRASDAGADTSRQAANSSVIRAGYFDDAGMELLDAGRDPKLPGLERLLGGGGGHRLISHRPGKRAVIRLSDGSFAKCVRRFRADGVIEGQNRAEAFRRGFALPQVLSADDSTVVLSAVPGVELHDPRALGADWSRAWTEALDAWALAAPTTAVAIPTHSADSEVQVLEQWRDRASGLLGQRLVEVDALIVDVRAELLGYGRSEPGGTSDEFVSGGSGNWGPIHRDLHDKQIMWDPDTGPGLLDVDTACLGERELDLGNLSAHVKWRTHQGIWALGDAETVDREISRLTSAVGLDPRRVRTYERSALVRLACVYAFRPRWSELTGLLLDAAREPLR